MTNYGKRPLLIEDLVLALVVLSVINILCRFRGNRMTTVAVTHGERFLTRQEAAEFLKLKPQTLSNWGMTQKYLPVYKIGGRCVRYKLSDLEHFMEEQRRSVVAD